MENQLLFKYKEPKDGLNTQGKPVKIYKRDNTPDYYLFAPKEPTRNGEINQLMLHCINEMGRQKNRYVFSLNDYFSFHNVTPELIPEIMQAIIEIKAMINPIWYNEFTPLIKEWIENWSVQKSLEPQQKEMKSNYLTAPVIALFCSLVNESKLIPKEINESVQNYCERVCNEFGLIYSDRIRQNFNNNPTKNNKQKVKELLLHNIDSKSSKIITDYLESKEQPNQKLYA